MSSKLNIVVSLWRFSTLVGPHTFSRKKYILLFAILFSTQVQAQSWGGWSRLWTYSDNTTSPARTVDTTQIFQLRIGTSTTAGFVPVADARGVMTLQAVSAAGAGDITAVTAGDALGGGGTTGAVTLNALATDGIKVATDTLRLQLATNSSLQIVSGVSALDSLKASTATVSSKGVWYLPPIQFAVDSAAGIASDTMWVWQNYTGSNLTVDSIHVAASSDDYAISIVKANHNGGVGTLVDAVTASTNGTNLFFTTETTITSAVIANGQRIGFKKPASTGDRVYVRIHYH